MGGALDDRVDGAGEQHDHQQLPDGVDPPRARGLGLRDEAPRERGRDQSDRHVHPEDRAPAARVDQRAAEHRAHRQADTDHSCPDADRLCALARVGEGVADDRHRHRVEHRAADGLHHAKDDQQLHGRGEAAQQRAEREQHQPELEDARASEAVGHRAREHQQAGEHQRVGVDRPLQLRDRRVQFAADRGQRDVHDRVVEPDDEQAHAADREDQVAAAVGGRRRLSSPITRAGRSGHRTNTVQTYIPPAQNGRGQASFASARPTSILIRYCWLACGKGRKVFSADNSITARP